MSDRFVIAGLIVLVTNAQGKLRQVPLTLKQSGRVRRFVSKLHEGGLHIAPEDLLLLTEKDAMETFGQLTGKLPLRERWKRRLARLKSIWFSYPNPLSKVVRPFPASDSLDSTGSPATAEPAELMPRACSGANLTVLPPDEAITAIASEE